MWSCDHCLDEVFGHVIIVWVRYVVVIIVWMRYLVM